MPSDDPDADPDLDADPDPDADPGGQGGCRWRAGQGCRPKSRLNS